MTRGAPSAALGRNQIGGSLRPPGLQSFKTEVTAILRALRVEGLIVTEYTEPYLEMACDPQLRGRVLARCEGSRVSSVEQGAPKTFPTFGANFGTAGHQEGETRQTEWFHPLETQTFAGGML